jgi:phenylalanine-4-hydroxylase
MVGMTIPPSTYWERRNHITRRAAGLHAPPAEIEYRAVENATWAAVADRLHGLWDRHACREIRDARSALRLPTDRIPQLAEVNAALAGTTGVRFAAVAGLLPAEEFFDALARSMFPSTQYIRWEGSPHYTPEPDIVHEVLGHGTALACPKLAELHRAAGRAVATLETPEAIQRVADVFWFTVEFGVVREAGVGTDEWKAYGAGLLSSPGELEWFGRHADVRPLDIAQMCATTYRLDQYQPVLFGAESLTHVLDVVGGFFQSATDDSVCRLAIPVASR